MSFEIKFYKKGKSKRSKQSMEQCTFTLKNSITFN